VAVTPSQLGSFLPWVGWDGKGNLGWGLGCPLDGGDGALRRKVPRRAKHDPSGDGFFLAHLGMTIRF